MPLEVVYGTGTNTRCPYTFIWGPQRLKEVPIDQGFGFPLSITETIIVFYPQTQVAWIDGRKMILKSS